MNSQLFTLLLPHARFPLTFILLAAGSYCAAQTINAVVRHELRELPSPDNAPPPPPMAAKTERAPSELARVVLERNLMNARRDDLTSTAEATTPDSNAVKPCSLSANLTAIIATGQAETSFVAYRDPKTQEAGLFAPSEGRNHLPNDAVLLDIEPNLAKFRRDGHLEICILGDDSKPTPANAPSGQAPQELVGSIDPGVGIKRISDTDYQIDQSELDRILGNLNEVATDARMVPSMSGGKSNGFKVLSIRPGSVFQRIGLLNGDVIQKINGYELNSPEKALEVYQKLRESKTIAVQVERGGSSKALSYQIR